MSRIELYDTTLRDGMQGEGMSLSAHEKLRVAHRLDELGIDLIEAGFPSSNPKELELFELLAGERGVTFPTATSISVYSACARCPFNRKERKICRTKAFASRPLPSGSKAVEECATT